MALTFNMDYEKLETLVQDPLTGGRRYIQVPVYTMTQLDELGANLETCVTDLGGTFISFVVTDTFGYQKTALTYDGPIVDDEMDWLIDPLDGVYQAWYMAHYIGG